jgi:hypothetical protein
MRAERGIESEVLDGRGRHHEQVGAQPLDRLLGHQPQERIEGARIFAAERDQIDAVDGLEALDHAERIGDHGQRHLFRQVFEQRRRGRAVVDDQRHAGLDHGGGGVGKRALLAGGSLLPVQVVALEQHRWLGGRAAAHLADQPLLLEQSEVAMDRHAADVEQRSQLVDLGRAIGQDLLHHYNHHRPHAGINADTPVARLNNLLGNDS